MAGKLALFISALGQFKYVFFIIVAGMILRVLDLLPVSPFQSINFMIDDAQFLRFLSWLIPIDFFILSTGIWLTAMVHFYGLKYIMRWLKMIG